MELSIKKFLNIDFFKRNPEFTKLFIGQFISNFGDWFHMLAIMMLLYKLTGSKLSFGLYILLRYFPSIVINSFSGVFIDRFSKKLILIFSDIGRFILISLIILGHKTLGFYWVILLLLISNIITAVYRPTRSSIVPELVISKDDVAYGNSALSFSFHFTLIFGTALGGIVLARIGTNLTLLIDALTFLISAIVIFFSNPIIIERKEICEKIKILKEIKIGIKEVISSKELLKSMVSFSWWQFGYGFTGFIWPVLVVEHFNKGEIGLGYNFSVIGVGCILGILIIQHYINKILSNTNYITKIIVGTSILNSILIFLALIQQNFYLFLFFTFLNSLVVTPTEIILETNIVNLAKNEVRGKVMSLFYMAFMLMWVTGLLLSMVFVNKIGIVNVGIIGCVIIFLTIFITHILNELKFAHVKEEVSE